MKRNTLFASLALCMMLCSQSFGAGLLDKMLGAHGCGCEAAPSCCAPEPTCCAPEPTCCAPEPTCCEAAPTCCAPEPTCCAPEPSCCDPCGCKKEKKSLLDHIIGKCKKKDSCCAEPTCCAPEPTCCAPEPTCCEAPTCCAPEPTCCAPEPSCCDPCGCKKEKKGLLDMLFGGCKKKSSCGSSCGEPACGCGAAPACGCGGGYAAPAAMPMGPAPTHAAPMTPVPPAPGEAPVVDPSAFNNRHFVRPSSYVR